MPVAQELGSSLIAQQMTLGVTFHEVYLPIVRHLVPLLIFWLLLLEVKTDMAHVHKYHLKFVWEFGHTLYTTPIQEVVQL